MSISAEIDNLVKLRDRGDLTQAEFEQAKARALSEQDRVESGSSAAQTDISQIKSGTPGLGMAIGVFVGNLIAISFFSGDIARGFGVGIIAAILVILAYSLIPGLRKQRTKD